MAEGRERTLYPRSELIRRSAAQSRCDSQDGEPHHKAHGRTEQNPLHTQQMVPLTELLAFRALVVWA